MVISVYFSQSGSPKLNLTPLITIIDLADNSVIVDETEMSEVGNGFYKYEFDLYDSTKDYVFICDSVDLSGTERYAIGSTATSGADIYNLLEKVWIHLPDAGGGGSPWSTEEKEETKKAVKTLVDNLGTIQQRLEKQDIKRKLKTFNEILDTLPDILEKKLSKKTFHPQFALIIDLLASLVKEEDLMRIEEKYSGV